MQESFSGAAINQHKEKPSIIDEKKKLIIDLYAPFVRCATNLVDGTFVKSCHRCTNVVVAAATIAAAVVGTQMN